MPGFHLSDQKNWDFHVPVWFQFCVGALPIPGMAKMALEAAYMICDNLPLILKLGALLDLRKSIRQGKSQPITEIPRTNESCPICVQINSWCERWNQMTRSKRDQPAPKPV